jgi:glycosyltransferase involved in cell wall biosynthesis
VIFEGPLYGDAKWQAFRAAALFVLPSRSENFGMAVAEALAAGTPTIVSNAAPWRLLPARNAGWSIDVGVDPLVDCLQRALSTPPERLTQMGLLGREWMLRDYSWHTIGAQYLATYRWLVSGGEPPACVRMN